MYEVKFVGLSEAEAAGKAIIEEASKTNGSPISVAIVAPDGYLVYLARMNGASWHTVVMAINKAYSAARMRNNTRTVGEYVLKNGWIEKGLSFGDDVSLIPGGVNIVEPVQKPGPRVSYGGIGISGRIADDDESLALIGLKALQDLLWPQS